MDNLDLSDFFTTKAQANDFATHLSKVIDDIYTTHFELEKVLLQEFGMRKKDAWMKIFRDNNISTTSADALQDFFKKLHETFTKLPIVSLTIAFEPSEDALKAFSQWFVSALKKQVVFDVVVNPQIIAGATITYNGKFKDFSIQSRCGEIISAALTPHAASVKQEELLSQRAHQGTQYITLGR